MAARTRMLENSSREESLAAEYVEKNGYKPVFKLRIDGRDTWLILGQEEIDLISKKPEIFSSEAEGVTPVDLTQLELEVARKQFINMDAFNHRRFRATAMKALVRLNTPAFRNSLALYTDQLTYEAQQDGWCDFVEDIAGPTAYFSIARLLDLPEEDGPYLSKLVDAIIYGSLSKAAAGDLYLYAIEWTERADKFANPGNALREILAAENLSIEEAASFLFLMIIAGTASTKVALAGAAVCLIDCPEQFNVLKSNHLLIPSAIEEILRLVTPFVCMRRTATKQTMLAGESIEMGEKILMMYRFGNLDSNRFGPDSHQFNVARTMNLGIAKSPHRAFGIGAHACIGSVLARLELEVLLESMLRWTDCPRFAACPAITSTGHIRRIERLHLNFGGRARCRNGG